MIKVLERVGLGLGIFALGFACSHAQAPLPAGGREIRGVVVSAKSGEPLAEAQLTLIRTKDRKQLAGTVADAEGRFAFVNLGDGKFDLVASHSGYVRAAFEEHPGGVSTAIVTGAGLVTTGLRFELAPLATIYGTITEDSGDPVRMARLSLYRRDINRGTGKMVRAAATMADPTGNFELSQLIPGTYFACAFGVPWYTLQGRTANGTKQDPATQSRLTALDVAYPATCYPDVTDPNAADAIAVAAGDRVELNIVMHATPALHLRLQSPDWDSKHPPQMPQLFTNIFGIPEQTTQNIVVNNPPEPGDGSVSGPVTVEIAGVPPGQYDMELSAQNGDSARHMSVDAAAENASIDLSAATPMAALAGKVSMANGGSLPAATVIWLRSRQGNEEAVTQVGADGSFTIQSVRPSEYDVMISAAGNLLAIVSLTARGSAVKGHVLSVGSKPIQLIATVDGATATVNGVVKRNGVPKSGVFVILVPDDPQSGLDMWQPNQSDSDGSFNFLHVLPGAYTVAAIEEGWSLDWSRPDVIAPYRARGVKVTVTPRAKEVNLPDAVEAQPLKLPQSKMPDPALPGK